MRRTEQYHEKIENLMPLLIQVSLSSGPLIPGTTQGTQQGLIWLAVGLEYSPFLIVSFYKPDAVF